MIRCIPTGLCSWNFRLGANGYSASAEFDWMTEQGTLTIDGERHDIEKHGPFSGHWTLVAKSSEVLAANKPSSLTRTFEISTPSGTATLRAASPFGRTMLLQGAGLDAAITPDHPFTRRSSITGSIPEFRTACFAFWLTVLLWRRATRNSQA